MKKKQSPVVHEQLPKKELEGKSCEGSPQDLETPPVNPAKSFWSRMTDPQAAVLAALIAAAVSLAAAGISVWNARQQRTGQQSEKTLAAYDGAISAIRHMKNQIQVVIAEKEITIENARNNLRDGSAQVDQAYEKNASVLIASDYYLAKEVFHGTKSSGRRAWSNLNGQSSAKLTPSDITALESIISELTLAEDKLQEKYTSLKMK
jgi:hypothetical protein